MLQEVTKKMNTVKDSMDLLEAKLDILLEALEKTMDEKDHEMVSKVLRESRDKYDALKKPTKQLLIRIIMPILRYN